MVFVWTKVLLFTEMGKLEEEGVGVGEPGFEKLAVNIYLETPKCRPSRRQSDTYTRDLR